MARWKALPEGLDPAVVQLVVQLRQLKDETGSSLERLAVRTGYSASSWERYLGGRLLPPREALEALAKAAGADPVRLLALHRAATEAWQSATPEQRPEQPQSIPEPQPVADDAPEADPRPGPDPEPAPGLRAAPAAGWRGPTWRTVITSAVAALTGAAVALAVVQPWQGATACAPAAAAVAPAPAPKYLCHYTRKDGEWYAGNSTTSTDVVQVTATGPDVAEIQCLLQRAGISPGGVDGSFGPLTEQAVIREQQVQKLAVDGSVGPQTWGALRK